VNGKPVLLLGFGMQGKVAFYDLARSDLVSRLTVVDSNLDSPGSSSREARSGASVWTLRTRLACRP
jgi:saccharopine dehydrogenase-like NADP-dependent oxidoreductase